MKKWLLIVWLCCTALVQAQEKVDYKDIQTLTFFGIDYSLVKLYGVGEEPYQYKMLFRELNSLFKTEPKTYNLKKFLGKEEVILSLEKGQEAINDIDPNHLKVFNKEYTVSDEQIKEAVRVFDTGDTTGYGAILFCTFLDRTKNRGTYYFVVFNTDTKEIIRQKQIEAKAAGTTFQTYWGASVLNALKQANK